MSHSFLFEFGSSKLEHGRRKSFGARGIQLGSVGGGKGTCV